jgi:NAD(P)-dependent dehydrogenase (short-subunit alcohol dehydrogenase family)
MKTAIVGYISGLAFQLAGRGVRANAVSPGNTFFTGGIWDGIKQGNAELYADSLALNPTGRMGLPEEMARAVVFLSSPVSSFTTGTNLVVDGALTRGIQL